MKIKIATMLSNLEGNNEAKLLKPGAHKWGVGIFTFYLLL